MPIIVVHGVNTRDTDAGYQARQALISFLVRRHLPGVTLNGKSLKDSEPVFPYWGNLGATFAWDMASLPSEQIDVLGGAIDSDIRPAVAMVRDDLGDLKLAGPEPLLAMARRSLPRAVSLLSELLLQDPGNSHSRDLTSWILAAERFADGDPHPTWLKDLSTDAQLISCITAEVEKSGSVNVETLGSANSIVDALSAATLKLKAAIATALTTAINRSGDFACTKLLAWQRRRLNAILGRFIGDVFVYLDSRGDRTQPGAIPAVVIGTLRESMREADDPLVVIAHSLGGVITFDVLSFFCPDLQVDLLVTVGSQVSHFEELKRFKASDAKVPSADTKRAKTPSNIRQWINVFDEVDIFAYACARVFERVIDFQYDTNTPTIIAHSAYLEQAQFYERLRKRLDTLQ